MSMIEMNCLSPSGEQIFRIKWFFGAQIIASHFVNGKVNSSYENSGMKIAKQFSSKGKFNFIISLFYTLHTLIKKKILLILKITPQNAKKASQFLKNIFNCSGVKASLRSE